MEQTTVNHGITQTLISTTTTTITTTTNTTNTTNTTIHSNTNNRICT